MADDQNSDLDHGRIQATGIGLREGEIAAADQIADGLEIKRNALLRLAIRWFIQEYRRGNKELIDWVKSHIVEPEKPAKKVKY